MQNLEKLINFFIEIESLKKTFRYSTCPENVRESSADHSWKLAFMALTLGERIKGVDIYHAVQICLVHDLVESIIGDIDSRRIALGEITKEQKKQMEERAMLKIKNKISGTGQKIYDLWKEFEEHKTSEAKYAQALDKVEPLIHLLSVGYITSKNSVEAGFVAKYADKTVSEFPQLKCVLDTVKSRLKKEFQKQRFKWEKDYN